MYILLSVTPYFYFVYEMLRLVSDDLVLRDAFYSNASCSYLLVIPAIHWKKCRVSMKDRVSTPSVDAHNFNE